MFAHDSFSHRYRPWLVAISIIGVACGVEAPVDSDGGEERDGSLGVEAGSDAREGDGGQADASVSTDGGTDGTPGAADADMPDSGMPDAALDAGFDHECEGATYTWLELTDNVTHLNGALAIPQYSTIGAFNADESLIFLPYYQGQVRTLNGDIAFTGVPFGTLTNGAGGCSYWDKDDPFKLYGTVRGDSHLYSVDVRNPTTLTEVFDAGSAVDIGGRQGQPNDAQTKVLLHTSSELIAVNPQTGAELFRVPRPANLDWSGFGHSGDYYVTAAIAEGNVRELISYRSSDQTQVGYALGLSHGDFVTHTDGTEYFARVGNPPTLFRLSDGAVTEHGPGSGWGHLSGRGPPGKMYFSFDDGGTYGNAFNSGAGVAEVVGELAVGDDFVDRMLWGTPPPHNQQDGSYASTQMKATAAHSGQYLLVVITNPMNVSNVYLVTKNCP